MEELFPSSRGGYAENALRKALKRAVKACGLVYGMKQPDGVTLHTFRHSAASIALIAGVPLNVVQRMGNWKTPVMVARYAKLADDKLREGVETLDRAPVGHKTVPTKENDQSDGPKAQDSEGS